MSKRYVPTSSVEAKNAMKMPAAPNPATVASAIDALRPTNLPVSSSQRSSGCDSKYVSAPRSRSPAIAPAPSESAASGARSRQRLRTLAVVRLKFSKPTLPRFRSPRYDSASASTVKSAA